MTQDNILQLLTQVVHPEQGKTVIELNLVRDLQITDKEIGLTLAFAKARDPFATAIKQQCEKVLLQAYPSYKPHIHLAFAEPAKPLVAADVFANVRHTIAIMSGKGGVGKSTVTVNIAVTLARQGYKVGLIDADIYGPSIPKMFGVEDERPVANKNERIIPVERYGVKMLSIGFFVNPADALVWRAPMAVNALKQLMLQADWGELDFLMIDMPPGTGDIHLSLINELTLSGAVVVSTPQQVALADAIKGIAMLNHEHIKVKLLGLVENMAWFTPAELPNNKYYIFGKGGVSALAQEMHVPLLGEVPLVQSICEGSDQGTPQSLQPGPVQDAFEGIVHNMIAQL